MPLPVIAGVVRITAKGTIGGGGVWTNTWHAQNDSEVDFDDAAIVALHAIFRQIYTGAGIGGGAAQDTLWYSGTSLDWVSYTPLNGTSGAYQIADSAVGIQTGASLPPEVCEVVTIRTGQRGRANRGRVFLPAWATSSNTLLGHMLSNSVNQTLAQIQGVQAAMITGGAHLGVGSYGPYKNPTTGILEPGTPHFTAANNFTMDDLFDVQRSRKT